MNRSTEKKLKAVIIGAGRIGATFDSPGDRSVLTHAHALSRTSGVVLCAAFDTDPDSLKRAAGRWGVVPYASFDEMMSTIRPEIVSVCVPDDQHEKYLRDVIPYAPRLVLAEKPVTDSYTNAKAIARAYADNGILCNVNYIRRFDPYLAELRSAYRNGDLGELLYGFAVYGKGVLHNGSHLIDLLRWFFGEIETATPYHGICDFSPVDPSVAFSVRWRKAGPMDVGIIDSRLYTAFEVHWYFGRLKISLLRGGIKAERTNPSEDPLFAGFRDLIRTQRHSTGLSNAMGRFVRNAVNALRGSEALGCSIEDVLETQRLCEELTNGWRKQNGTTRN
jgi:predicted dehydrogenase